MAIAIDAPLTSSRRFFLLGLGSLCAIAPKPAEPQKVSPVPKVPPPKFWFCDYVSYPWLDEAENPQDEFGQVVGLAWHPLKEHWEYAVVWLTSTRYTGRYAGETYPSYDHELMYEKEMERADLEVMKLCKL